MSKKTDNILSETCTRFKDIFSKIPVGIILFDNNLKITEANDAFLKLLNNKQDIAVGLNIRDLNNDKIIPALIAAISGNEGFYEGQFFPLYGSDNIYISIHTKPYIFYDKKTKIKGGIAIFKDITEDKIAERAVTRSYDIFQTVTDNINSLLYVIDIESHNIIFANSVASKLLGKHTGTLCYELFFPEKNEVCKDCPIKDLSNKTDKPDKVIGGEYFSNKIKRWFNFSYNIVKWINGKTVLLLSLIDITEKKNVEFKIKTQNKELEWQTAEFEKALLQVTEQNVRINQQSELLKLSSYTKDTMFSIIGHDLRGPVGNIKNILDILLEDYELFDNEEIKEFIKTVRDSAGSAYNLLANLLYWAKNQSGKMNFAPEQLSVNEIVDENINLFKANLEQKKIELIYNPDKELQITGDENMLNTIVRNLISNAVKFTPCGGKIKIKINEIEDEKILFIIEDTGVGIKKENLLKIFNTNEHYTTYGTDNEKGSGLGLILCKEFTERHKGKIWVNSTSEKGTIFSFIIPKTVDY